MPEKTTENSKTLSFNEEEALAAYTFLYRVFNQIGLKNTPLVLYTLIFIGTEELRKQGIPMGEIMDAIASVEQFKEKAN